MAERIPNERLYTQQQPQWRRGLRGLRKRRCNPALAVFVCLTEMLRVIACMQTWWCDAQSCDQCHPNDNGYAHLASALYKGLALPPSPPSPPA